MRQSRVTRHADELVMEDPQAALERAYIEEYLRGQGYTLQSLQDLPEEEAKRLMIEASSYASAKLAEVEMRAQFVDDIHGTAPPL